MEVKKLAAIVVAKNWPNLFRESAWHARRKKALNIEVRAPPNMVGPICPSAKFVLCNLFVEKDLVY